MPARGNLFQQVPFLRISGMFLIGIVVGQYSSRDIFWTPTLATILICSLIFFWHSHHYSLSKVQDYLIPMCILAFGMMYSNQNTSQEFNIPERRDYFLAEVAQKPAEKANTYQTILNIQNPVVEKPQKIIAYLSKEQFDSDISIGDQLIILGKPQWIKNSGNPFEFDYESIVHKKGIYYSVYLPFGTYRKTGIHFNRIKYLPEKIRERLISILKNSSIKEQNLSVIQALTLGYRAELDQETIDYFASTGAMHVLAVSGLHVGLIYFILGYLFSGIKRTNTGRKYLFPTILITLLWSYAFLTGFSPSVQRATIMFTFIVIGESIRRPVNIYNSLSASALFLMLLNPEVIFEVGFQLSYLAVFGIVLIQPALAGIIEVRNKILRFMWDLFTVSIAAQLATFPLGLFYFNQFPNFFWLSNFVVIPAATILIWLTFGFFILSPFPFVAVICAQLIDWLTSVMLYLLKIISEIPHAVSEGIIIGQLQVWIIYSAIISLMLFWHSKRKQWLYSGLILLIFLQCNILISKFKLINQQAVYVYNAKNVMIHLINGRSNYLLTNDFDTLQQRDLQIVENVRNHLRLDSCKYIKMVKEKQYQFSDLTIRDGKVHYLNCMINLSEISYNKRSLIRISLLNDDVGLDQAETFQVSTGNGSDKQIHFTGNEGAWMVKLNNRNLTSKEMLVSSE